MSRIPESSDGSGDGPIEGEWLPPEPRVVQPALGCDPFATPSDPDPFEAGLTELGLGGPMPSNEETADVAGTGPLDAPAVRPIRARADHRPGAAGSLRGAGPSRLRGRAARASTLGDVDLREPADWLERLLDEDERRRLVALLEWAAGEGDYDRFGLSATSLRRAFPFFLGLYRAWFRVRSSGHEHLPHTGPAILAANHGGLLPFDGAMLVMDVALSTDPPRLLRAIVDYWVGKLPFVSVFYARVGQVIGTRENFADLLAGDQLVLVFPEGMDGARKLVTQRNRLQSFRRGFIEQALRAQAPVIPTAVIGSDDQAPILFDLKPVARALGLPTMPVTPTFPLLGPLGLVPYPVPYRIVYGEPMPFHERFGPDGANDPRLVRYLARLVRREVQLLIDKNC